MLPVQSRRPPSRYLRLKLDPKLLPVIRATLRSREQLEEARARAKALTAEQVKAVPSQPA